MSIVEIITLIFSLIAIIISISVAILQHFRETKMNKANLEAVYFNEIYKEYLLNRIPVARKFIMFDLSGNLIGIDKMMNILRDIKFDSLYYFYNDESFYNELKNACEEFEDFLVEISNKVVEIEYRNEFDIQLQQRIKKIYSIINKKFLGS